MTIAVYGRHTLAGAKQIVFDEGINIAPRAKSPRERLIEISRRYQAEQDAQRERQIEAQEKASLPKRVSVKPCEEKKAASITRERSMPGWARQIVVETARKHRISLLEMLGSSRTRIIVTARNEAYYLIRMDSREPSYPRIGRWFSRDHTGILWGAAKHALVSGLPAPGNCDIEKNMARKRKAANDYHRGRKCD